MVTRIEPTDPTLAPLVDYARGLDATDPERALQALMAFAVEQGRAEGVLPVTSLRRAVAAFKAARGHADER